LIRAAQNYASNYLEQWLEAHPLPIKVSDHRQRQERVEENAGSREPQTVRFPTRP
jgi:hypothetical protein